jgi:hypothetical protein
VRRGQQERLAAVPLSKIAQTLHSR